MGEVLTATGAEVAPARVEPLVIEERPVRFWAFVIPYMLVVNAAIVALKVWRGTESDWSRLSEPLLGLTIGAVLIEVVRSALGTRRRIAVHNGVVSGPGAWWRQARFSLSALDRVRLAAQLARPWWRRANGFDLRSTSGDRIAVSSWSFDRADRELLLRAVGVASATRA